MTKSVLALGPYIGSFEHEILTFRPHMRWVEQNTNYKAVFYSTHFNRRFLYPEVNYRRFMPVYKQLTRYENEQDGYSHKDVDQRDFISLIKTFKEQIVDSTRYIKKDIDHISLPYVKYAAPVSIYHKIFEPIKVPLSKKKGYVVFIPDASFSEEDSYIIYKYLQSKCDFSVIGDMKCHLYQYNEVIQSVDYIQNGYQKIVTAITNARAVLTPCSVWTTVANLQGAPVLSWGEGVGQYKEGGIYHFGNKKSKVVYHDSDSKADNLIRQIDKFLEDKL
jgi:hypothetical protein